MTSSFINVTIHSSQYPAQVAGDLRQSLLTREINHKFHYDSYKQTQKWLALHEAYSPSRLDADCASAYDASFKSALQRIESSQVFVIGLGCGGGQKDTRLLKLLQENGKEAAYSPVDVSTPMVLVACDAASEAVSNNRCHPLVCDLATSDNLGEFLNGCGAPGAVRVITFFGMIPNFEPHVILPGVSHLLRAGDLLLLSANLAPGPDYAAAVNRILPQYDNPLTRDWLLTFLLDLGIERSDGELLFTVEEGSAGKGLLRIVGTFHFTRRRALEVNGQQFAFAVGETIRLFFSYRYTPDLLRTLWSGLQLHEEECWLIASGEEGIFLLGR